MSNVEPILKALISEQREALYRVNNHLLTASKKLDAGLKQQQETRVQLENVLKDLATIEETLDSIKCFD